ncbi:hypothetical protein HME9302_00696 [Alteripontixanthobacter maritimus]|uniref:DUF805 domain-containing protein n=1 Tax=Alteripontixanthobacter maritimus TaxID=2161824 RepID=A0A369Q8M3_9SPHN|nr:DUF805 domain-containing protein [Alteripontixanthobacter maritimus]RDC59506.1 hypothetical protein HME9302_00696 [Alteripontixanthobacter maritimus]
MSILDTLKRPFVLWNVWQDRAGRREYWLFTLANLLVGLALVAISLAAGIEWANDGVMRWSVTAEANADNPAFRPLSIIIAIWLVVVTLPYIGLNVRRLHDRGFSGWWYLGYVVLSSLPVLGISLTIAYFIQMALPGTKEENRYGPDPVERNPDYLLK